MHRAAKQVVDMKIKRATTSSKSLDHKLPPLPLLEHFLPL